MSQYDVEIDIPDDDNLGSDYGSADSAWAPNWVKPLLLMMLIAVLVLMLVAFVAGRKNSSSTPDANGVDDGAGTDNSVAPDPQAENGLIEARAVEAIRAWEGAARTGNTDGLDQYFDPEGPQYEAIANNLEPTEVAFLAIEPLVSTTDNDAIVVSLTMVVVDAAGESRYLYDLVYREGSNLVWTVVDRGEAPESSHPPEIHVVESATRSWNQLVEAIDNNDSEQALASVSGSTRQLAEQIFDALTSSETTSALIGDAMFSEIVERVRLIEPDHAGDIVIYLVGDGRVDQFSKGSLVSWTTGIEDLLVAQLDVEGEVVTSVPFSETDGDWSFDLVAAMELAS